MVESAVVSSPDAMRGEVVKAFVMLKEAERSTKDHAKLTEEL